MTKKKTVTLWIIGVPLLLGLNLKRDLSYLAAELHWHPVERQTLNRSVSSPGVVEAIRVEDITVDVRETVLKIFVRDGEKVKKGQKLIELSRTNTQLEFEQKRNSLNEYKGNYRKARKELRVQKKLLRNYAVSQAQVEEAARNMQKAKASLDIMKREFQIVKKKLAGTMVVSPMDGQVLKINVGEGMRVGSDKPLISVGDTTRFISNAKVDELDIRLIQDGQPAAIRIDAFPDLDVKGEVTSIATQADRDAFAKLSVTVDILDSGGTPLRHNLSCRVDILTEKLPDAIGVPYEAILRKDGNKGWVLVKNKIGFLTEREVELGGSAGDYVVINGGLEVGEQVGTRRATAVKS